MNRSADNLRTVVAGFGLETNPVYLPANGLTWCNRYLSDVTTILDCPIPFRLADAQIEWLKSLEGAAHGWTEVPQATASAAVELGHPAAATWSNPDGHGHVALCVPWLKGPRGVYVSQAGARNFSYGPLARGFGSHPVVFYAHE